MKLTPRIAAIMAALIIASPAIAINTKPEPPKKEPPVEQPEPPKEKPKPEPRAQSKPRAQSQPKPEPRASVERERSECPYTRRAENNWKCAATVRPRARPVTVQTMQGEKR